jgi:hypothetical protein
MKLIELAEFLVMIGIIELCLFMRRAEEMRVWRIRFSILRIENRKTQRSLSSLFKRD